MTTLTVLQDNLQQMMTIIDDTEEITDDIIDKFIDLKIAREMKIDAWIGYRDRAKYLVEETKERRQRHQQAYTTAKRLKERIDQRLKYHIESDTTGVPFKGHEAGTLYLQKSQKKLVTLAPCTDSTVYNVITDDFYKEICHEYLQEITFFTLDKSKLKDDLLNGVDLTWATLEQSKHIRVKG